MGQIITNKIDQSSQASNNGCADVTAANKKTWYEAALAQGKVKDFFRALLYMFVAFCIYEISLWVLSSGMGYFVRHLIALIICLFFLWAYSIAQKEKTETGRAVVVFLLLFFVCHIANHYFISKPEEKNLPGRTEKIGLEIKMIEQSGTYVFDLKAGSSTGWLGFSDGKVADVSYSSPDYNYRLNYSDGSSYDGGKDVIVPEKNHCYVNILAKTNQYLTMTVRYR